MKIGIVCSKVDPAGRNVYGFLKQKINLITKHEIILQFDERESVYCEHIDKELGVDMLLFATQHKSKSGVASLTCHVQGNWSEALMGGSNSTLAMAPCFFIKKAIQILEKNAGHLHYEVIQEATHHGPDVSVPSMFMEIGASIEEWENPTTGEIMADCIIELLNSDIESIKSAVGLGGLHHAPSFKKIQLDNSNGVAVGHICPKHNLEELDINTLKEAIEKSDPKATLVIADWKGLGPHKDKVRDLCEQLSIELKKTKEF